MNIASVILFVCLFHLINLNQQIIKLFWKFARLNKMVAKIFVRFDNDKHWKKNNAEFLNVGFDITVNLHEMHA